MGDTKLIRWLPVYCKFIVNNDVDGSGLCWTYLLLKGFRTENCEFIEYRYGIFGRTHLECCSTKSSEVNWVVHRGKAWLKKSPTTLLTYSLKRRYIFDRPVLYKTAVWFSKVRYQILYRTVFVSFFSFSLFVWVHYTCYCIPCVENFNKISVTNRFNSDRICVAVCECVIMWCCGMQMKRVLINFGRKVVCIDFSMRQGRIMHKFTYIIRKFYCYWNK